MKRILLRVLLVLVVLKIGDTAPDFELKKQNASERIRLSQFRGSRPVVLVFGSYT